MPDHEFWQPDPTGRHKKRWRRTDGTWGDKVRDGARQHIDPYDGPPPEQPEPTHAAPTAAPMSEPATGREPLGFWRTAFAVAVGVLVAAAAGLTVLAVLAVQAMEDLL